MKHLKWGLIGAGSIANAFADGLNSTDQATALAIGSRSLEKAQQFASKHELPRAYGSYDEVLRDREVDAVYIALPNNLHAEWSIKAAEAGKHILCEKPAAMNSSELEQVLAVVKRQDVFFMEAYMYRCHPQLRRVRELIDAGTIGEVRVLRSSFAFNMGYDHPNIRLVNATGGGGLMDVGGYCVAFSRFIAESEPVRCSAVAHLGKKTRVDEWMVGILQFPGDIVAHFTSAIECNVPTCAEIYGSKGSISLTNPWFPADGSANIIVFDGEKTETIEVNHGRHLYGNEALTVAEYIDQRQSPTMNWADSMGQARAMDALRADMGLVWESEKDES